MLDKDRSLNFAVAVEEIAMTSADAVECLLDFSKGPEAVVTTANGTTYFGHNEEALNYTILENKQKTSLPSHRQAIPQPPIDESIATPAIENLDDYARSIKATTNTAAKPRAICSFCGKSFSHLGDHNKHRRRHTGERPYRCDLCPKSFAHASNLTRHRRLHSGEKPFQCTNCSRRFSRKDKLSAHVARMSCCKMLTATGRTAVV